MALSFTTGMTEISDADAIDNWAAYKITAGGASPTAVVDTQLMIEGSGCVSCIPTNGKDCGMTFDYYTANGDTVLDLSAAGSEVIGIWIQILSPAVIDTISAGGVYIILCGADGVPSSSNAWAKWYIMGSDEFKQGWNYFEIDTRKTPSATNGGWTSSNLSAVYQIGAGAVATASWKAEWLYIDRMAYGRPIYTVKGDGSLIASWSDFLDHSETEVNGMIADVNGAYALSCGIQFGDNGQSASTTFLDATNQSVNFKSHKYYYGSDMVEALNYSDYYKVSAEGGDPMSNKATSVTLGSLVGTDEGILGGTIKSLDPINVPVTIDFNTDQADISALNFYGVTFQGLTGDIDLGNNSDFNYFSCTFLNCEQIDPNGDPEIRNCLFINTAGSDSALLWNENIDISDCKFIANVTDSGGVRAAIEHPSAVGTPYDYDNLTFSGNTYDVYNSSGSAIEISKTNGSNPTNYYGSSVTFIGAAVTLTVTCKTALGVNIQNARVLLETFEDSGTGAGPFPFEDAVTIINADDSGGPTAYVTHANHGLANGDHVVIKGASYPENNGVQEITITGANSYSYELPSFPGTSPSGSIKATFAPLYGLTDIDGEISSDPKVYSSNQAIVGWARKSTSTPFYKTSVIIGEVDDASGFATTAIMILDQ